jgi:exodeoxyribonuclease III
MRIATFNVNGIKARLPQLLDWLREAEPDVAALQEIKCVDAGFPGEEIEALGYNVATHGQKGFNGVALLAKRPLEDVSRGLPGGDDDAQARWIEATVGGEVVVRVCGLYLPNGNPAPGPKYDYKLAWMERLHARAAALVAEEACAVIAGDFNVIPQGEDCFDPRVWADDALFLLETREVYRRVVNLGLTDAVRVFNRNARVYTFWDYQAGAWQKNNGIRIDHLLLTPQAADRLSDAAIDKHVRGWEKPSDHVPVWVDLAVDAPAAA